MGRFLRYEQCPACLERGRDNRGDNLGVYADGGAHCFACGFHRFPRRFSDHSINDVLKPDAALLPTDFTREVPTEGWKWLLQYGLPYTYWKEYCGYSDHFKRLVFLVGQPLQFSIGRLLGPAEGNHASRRKWYVWGNSHKHCEVVNPQSGKEVALVEDLISAHKVGQVTTAIPLFGTRIHPCHLYYLRSSGRPIRLWLDKDQEGTVTKTASWLQMMTDSKVDVLITDKDPKAYTTEQIGKLLE